MSALRTYRAPQRLAWTEDDGAQELIARDPIAFVIGFILDQQVRVQLAFAAPLKLQERLGHLNPERIAAMPIDELEHVFRSPSPLHRYPAAMAKRVQACMLWITQQCDGDIVSHWRHAADLDDLRTRIENMPGFGAMKAVTVSSVLAHQFGMDVEGWDAALPPYGSLALVDSLDDLADYQQRKGAYKKAIRSGASPAEAAQLVTG